jgi:iron complex outermembrane receptor protein
MARLLRQLKLGGSTIAVLAATSLFHNTDAYAQGADNAATPGSTLPIEDVVVTGTNIRGVSPIGSDLVTVDQESIQTTGGITLEQVLADLPMLTGFGQAGQGSEAGSTVFAPNIHQLGSSASTSTLTLIDGHRFPIAATSHSEVDPNIVAPNMIERIEVIADGTSSIYGSDAVAGVVNLITRKSFEGLQLDAQLGTGEGVNDKSFNMLWGASGNIGSMMFAASYAFRGAITNQSHLAFINPNHIAEGGTNFDSFNCNPATVQPNGTGNIYLSPTSGTSVANVAANSPCFSPAGDLFPSDVRTDVMAKLVHNFSDRLEVDGEVVFSDYNDHTQADPGTVTATAFGPGAANAAQINPFYQLPVGFAGVATKESVRYDFNGLLPPTISRSGADYLYSDIKADFAFFSDWHLTAMGLAGWSEGYTGPNTALCGSCVDLALNGTTNTSGSLTTPSIVNTNIIVTQSPLTASNALDVWNPVASNKTSPTVLAGLETQQSDTRAIWMMQQARADLTGTLFDLPAGPLKVAVGGEMFRQSEIQSLNGTLNIGPSAPGSAGTITSGGSQEHTFHFGRIVYAAYGEFDIPVISPDMDIPFVKKVDVDLAARYDHYSDVGPTTNPKVSADWTVLDGWKLRANWSTSFVAPALDSIGDPSQSYNASYSGVSVNNGGFTANPALFPIITSLPAGAAIQSGTAATPCTGASASCVVGSTTFQGITFIRGGGPSMRPQTGHGWSVGTDVAPNFLPNFSASLTWWNNTFIGGVTSPNIAFDINNPALGLVTFYPSCATPAQVQALTGGIPVTAVLPACILYIQNFDQRNVLNLAVSGVDASFHYVFSTDDFGAFKLAEGLTQYVKFHQQVGAGGPVFSVLNTNGFNQTFPSVSLTSRFDIGWTYEGIAADLFWNFTGGYRNFGANTVLPILDNAQGFPVGGGDPVTSNSTFDLHVSYELPQNPYGDQQVFLTATNFLNSRPPFYNSLAGYDSYEASPIGRIISIGFREKL